MSERFYLCGQIPGRKNTMVLNLHTNNNILIKIKPMPSYSTLNETFCPSCLAEITFRKIFTIFTIYSSETHLLTEVKV